jgi:hypothetical protein
MLLRLSPSSIDLDRVYFRRSYPKDRRHFQGCSRQSENENGSPDRGDCCQFDNLHLLMEEKGKDISGVVVEVLTSLQKKILAFINYLRQFMIYPSSVKLSRNYKMSEIQVLMVFKGIFII